MPSSVKGDRHVKRQLWKLFVWLAFLTPSHAFAVGYLQPTDCKYFRAISASADHTSTDVAAYGKPFDFRTFTNAAVQLNWAALTGTIDASVKLQVSNDNSSWVDKSGAVLNLSGADGSGMINLVGSVTEAYYRLVYTHGSVSGGTLTGYCTAKE